MFDKGSHHAYTRSPAPRSHETCCYAFPFHVRHSYRVGLQVQANFSAPTSEHAHDAHAGQRAALSVQSAAVAM